MSKTNEATQVDPDSPASITTVVFLGAVAVAGFNIQPMYLGALADHLSFSAEELGLVAGSEIAGGALAGRRDNAGSGRADDQR